MTPHFRSSSGVNLGEDTAQTFRNREDPPPCMPNIPGDFSNVEPSYTPDVDGYITNALPTYTSLAGGVVNTNPS